jgi:hypothetical protein
MTPRLILLLACMLAASGVTAARADFQDPQALPRQMRNHCSFVDGHYVCANHCGAGYQITYCGPASFGCCHAGYGYCDWHGDVRCAPYWDIPRF